MFSSLVVIGFVVVHALNTLVRMTAVKATDRDRVLSKLLTAGANY